MRWLVLFICVPRLALAAPSMCFTSIDVTGGSNELGTRLRERTEALAPEVGFSLVADGMPCDIRIGALLARVGPMVQLSLAARAGNEPLSRSFDSRYARFLAGTELHDAFLPIVTTLAPKTATAANA